MNVPRTRWVALALGLGALGGCREAPTGPGACPAFCPPESVKLVDSVFVTSILSDSTFVGFVTAYEAGGLQLVNDPSGGAGVAVSRGVVRFSPFPERVLVSSTDTTTAPVLSLDSFRIRIPVRLRSMDVNGLELALYRLPSSVDSTSTFAALDPFFADSQLIAVVPVPDTLVAETVAMMLPASAFPTFAADGRRAAVGIALRSPSAAFLNIGAFDAGSGAQLLRFVQIQGSDGPVSRSETRLPVLDTYVAPPIPAPAPDIMRIGGVPAARAVIRLELPPAVIDSAEIVRATLVLVPSEPLRGAPGDSMRILVQSVAADVGAKSPLLGTPLDSLLFRSRSVRVGRVDTVRLDITDLVAGFRADPERPRMLVLRALAEGATFAEARFGSIASAAGRPALHMTFLPPVNLGFQ